jgi:hypothetical protein
MPTYPTSLPITTDSRVAHITDRMVDRASNGAARGRVFFTAAKRRFSLAHTALNSAQREVFEDFHAANLAGEFDLIWPLDGITYTCIFAGEPDYQPLGSGLANVRIEVAEV